ncbi:MAG: NlpC/P60 family protein [Jatrophihabitantaceae bacterium]
MVAILACLATVAALLLIPSPGAQARAARVAAPPPNPSDSQLSNAATQKSNLATEVGNLSAQAATMQSQLIQLHGNAELAEQKYAFAVQKLQSAIATAVTASNNAAVARTSVAAAQREFVAYAQASYMDGQVGGTTGTLLSAGDPNVLLQQGALQQYQSSHQISAIGTLQRATVAQSNADAIARKAVNARTAATKAASDAKATAIALLARTKVQAQQVQQTLDASQARLDAARATLMTLTGQRATYDAYVKEQARLAELRRQAELRREQAAAREAARLAAQERARQRAAANNGGGNNGGGNNGGGGGSSNGGGGGSSAPSGGGWTAARGQDAASRASRWVGLPYCWDGGDSSGPTYGAGGPGCGVGFDCSGLTLNAWAPYIALDHYTVTQYYNAGSVHPTPGNFLPGDLLFWGTTSNIHHVAIYVGNGDVIQAPDFGIPIEVTPWDQVESDYFGATRPMT